VSNARVVQYRLLAELAFRRADSLPDGEVRWSYQNLAEGWLALADQVETDGRIPSQLGSPTHQPMRHALI